MSSEGSKKRETSSSLSDWSGDPSAVNFHWKCHLRQIPLCTWKEVSHWASKLMIDIINVFLKPETQLCWLFVAPFHLFPKIVKPICSFFHDCSYTSFLWTTQTQGGFIFFSWKNSLQDARHSEVVAFHCNGLTVICDWRPGRPSSDTGQGRPSASERKSLMITDAIWVWQNYICWQLGKYLWHTFSLTSCMPTGSPARNTKSISSSLKSSTIFHVYNTSQFSFPDEGQRRGVYRLGLRGALWGSSSSRRRRQKRV